MLCVHGLLLHCRAVALLLFFTTALRAHVSYPTAHPYYYYQGQKILLAKDWMQVYISGTFASAAASLPPSVGTVTASGTDVLSPHPRRWAIVTLQGPVGNEATYRQRLEQLVQSVDGVESIAPFVRTVFLPGTGAPPAAPRSIGISHLFHVKLRQLSDSVQLRQKADSEGVIVCQQNPFMPRWYTLACGPQAYENALEKCNKFWETGAYADVDPGFLFHFRPNCTNDPEFANLWGLYNSTDTAKDVDACQAWTLTRGAGVKVAVVDEGIEKSHSDLAANISPLSYNTHTNGGPSGLFGRHGTHVAGIIGAIRNNNKQVVGVAPEATLLDVSDSLSYAALITQSVRLANGINWSWKNGADVINNSWGDQGGTFYSAYHSSLLENAIHNAMDSGRNGKGAVVVFGAGNQGYNLDYPADFSPKILTVGAMGSTGAREPGSSFAPQLDVAAPGVGILSTVPVNNIGYLNGTSMAAPHAAGIAALVLSVNPCLTREEVVTIIERTCHKVNSSQVTYAPEPGRYSGTRYAEFGYGLVNAYDAVRMAQGLYRSGADLYTKDDSGDIGAVGPFGTGSNWDKGPDIWVRTTANGFTNQTHENPELGQTNYVYVRVHNRGCQPSAGTERLNVYWTKKSSWSSWPANWDGSDPAMGDRIGAVTVPVLQPGRDTILQLTWSPPATGAVCLLTRIDNAPADPITVYPNRLDQDILLNNNISIRNVTIVDILPFAPGPAGGVVLVGNALPAPGIFGVAFKVPYAGRQGTADVTADAEVRIALDSLGWAIFQGSGGLDQPGIKVLDAEQAFLVTQPEVTIGNLAFPAGTRVPLTVSFHFLTEALPGNSRYEWRLSQHFADTPDVLLGSESFLLSKAARVPFYADAGPDQTIHQGAAATLTATAIGEDATYRWYTATDSLIGTGLQVSVVPAASQLYKLEVVSAVDGFKDYDWTGVAVQNRYIAAIAPNPASAAITIHYVPDGAASASLKFIPAAGGPAVTQAIPVAQGSYTLPAGSLSPGSYQVLLLCNGIVVDGKPLQVL